MHQRSPKFSAYFLAAANPQLVGVFSSRGSCAWEAIPDFLSSARDHNQQRALIRYQRHLTAVAATSCLKLAKSASDNKAPPTKSLFQMPAVWICGGCACRPNHSDDGLQVSQAARVAIRRASNRFRSARSGISTHRKVNPLRMAAETFSSNATQASQTGACCFSQ